MSTPTLESELADDNRHDIQGVSASSPLSPSIIDRDCGFIPIPQRLRFNPDKPPHFGYLLNVTMSLILPGRELIGLQIILGLASTFTGSSFAPDPVTKLTLTL
jgi:hypothetical protein